MQLNLTGHHVDITPALRDYVTSKLEKVERHFDHVTNFFENRSINASAESFNAMVKQFRAL